MENQRLNKEDIINASSSMKEEQFMYLSIIVALLAYNCQIYWLVWFFGIKGTLEGLTSIWMAFREYKKVINNQ
jgi:hypothetical protein